MSSQIVSHWANPIKDLPVDEQLEQEDTESLLVYYCLFCGDYILISDTSFDRLPRRKTDNAIIVDEDKVMIRFNTAPGKNILIQRSNGFEKKRQFCCPGCRLVVAYDIPSTSEDIKSDEIKYVYILPDGITTDPTQVKVKRLLLEQKNSIKI